MKQLPEASLVIITSNRFSFLLEAINSALAGEDAFHQIVIVSNSTSRLTNEQIDIIESLSPIISVHEVPLCGPSLARNIGAFFANGDILCFLDDDDLLSRDYLKTVRLAFESGADVVLASFQNFDKSKINTDVSSVVLNPNSFALKNPGVTGSNISLKKEAFESLLGFDYQLFISEDKDLFLRALAKNLKINCLKETLVFRRVHNNQLSDSPFNQIRKIASKRLFLQKHSASFSIYTRLMFGAELSVLDSSLRSFWPARLLAVPALIVLLVGNQHRYIKPYLKELVGLSPH